MQCLNENYNWILYSEDSVQKQNGYWEETVTIGKQTWYRYTRSLARWYIAVEDYDPSIFLSGPPEKTCAEGFHLPSAADWKKLFDTMDANVPGNNAVKYFANRTDLPEFFGKEFRMDRYYWASDKIDDKYAKCLGFSSTSYSIGKCDRSIDAYIACVRDED